jgi:hypothetical protein
LQLQLTATFSNVQPLLLLLLLLQNLHFTVWCAWLAAVE